MMIASSKYRSANRMLPLFALTLPCVLLATACDDPEQEAELAALDAIEASDELAAEEAAEAEEAAGSPLDQSIDVLKDRPDPAKGFATLCCTIDYPSTFDPHARLSTLSSEGCSIGTNIPGHAVISFQVTHYWGSPGPFNGVTTGPLANNSTKSVALTHSGSLDAMACTAVAVW